MSNWYVRFPMLTCWPIVASLLLIGLGSRLVYGLVAPVFEQSTVNILWLGLLFDLRWILLLLIPCWWLLRLARLVFAPLVLGYLTCALLAIVLVVWLGVFVLDNYYYQYTGQRLDAYIINLIQETEAVHFVWQSYPVAWLMLLAVGVFWSGFWLMGRWWQRYHSYILGQDKKWLAFFGKTLLLTLAALPAIWGSLSQFPLRWSDFVCSQQQAGLHWH